MDSVPVWVQIVALLALNVSGIGFLGLMGTVAALSVATAVLVAVTLTPGSRPPWASATVPVMVAVGVV